MFDNLVISLCKFTTLLNAPEVSVVKSSEYLSLFLKGLIFFVKKSCVSRNL